MDKLKLMTILGTRPEIIKLAEVIKRADIVFDHILVHTGQNWDYTLNERFFQDLEIREPNYYLSCVGGNLGETMSNIIVKTYQIIDKIKPDAILILGDTNSSLAAICAKRLKVPIFHMEAGNRCFDENLPEEINRRIVDHISDINMPYTEHARQYLASEGIRKENIIVTGSPMRELILRYKEKINESNILESLGLKQGKYIILSAHREENIDNEENFLSLMGAINDVAKIYEMPIIYSTHPRSAKYIEKRKFIFNPLVKKMSPFGFFDYNKLQMNAFLVLSDSGTLAEESSILGFNAISLRTSTERPEVFDKGSMIIGGIKSNDVVQAIEFFINNPKKDIIIANDYCDDNVSIKVVNAIQSFTKIINLKVWGKK